MESRGLGDVYKRQLRVWSLARTSKVFTLRGVGMKFLRYVITVLIGLEATERLLERAGIKARRDRERPEEMTRLELIAEIKKLRRLSDRWEEWHAAHEDHQRRTGGATIDRVVPNADEQEAPAVQSPADPHA